MMFLRSSRRELFAEMLREQLTRAQNRMKLYVDINRTDRSFQVGEQVLLNLQPYAQGYVVNMSYPKIAFKYFGPYTILEKVGTTTFKLQLPAGSMVHPIFIVSQFKEFNLDYTPTYSPLTDISALDISEILPEKIVDCRLIKRGNVAITQILVQWSGLPESSATWEDYHVLKKRFPMAAVWRQSASSVGGGGGGRT
jgi:hypothetical protein